jgi:hypothetical protein
MLAVVWWFVFWVNVVFGVMDPESVDRAVLIRQIQFCDFQKIPREVVVRVVNRVDVEFGLDAKLKPEFKFSAIEKLIIAKYQNQFQKNIIDKKSNTQTSRCECNLQVIAKVRYFQLMQAEADAAMKSEVDRKIVMKRIVMEVKYWDKVYRDFLAAADLPQPTFEEALEQIEKMISDFKQNESADQIRKIELFKQKIFKSLTQHEVNDAIKNITNTINTLFTPAKKIKQKEKAK